MMNRDEEIILNVRCEQIRRCKTVEEVAKNLFPPIFDNVSDNSNRRQILIEFYHKNKNGRLLKNKLEELLPASKFDDFLEKILDFSFKRLSELYEMNNKKCLE